MLYGHQPRSSQVKIPLYWIDAFSRQPFHGNPAGVCPLDDWLPDKTMQQIAFENGIAETAFFVPVSDGRYHLRWFTPQIEVDLCGHATLASAYVVFNELQKNLNQVTFDSKSGPLQVERKGDRLEMDFPGQPPLQSPLLRQATCSPRSGQPLAGCATR